MTGTGYLSLASILRTHGVLDESGHFGQGNTPLAAKLAQNVTTITDEPAFRLNNGLYLPASDVEEIMKVKAAFNLAMSALLEEAAITPSQLTAIHIAGALGEHVSLNDLEVLGFLPPGTRTKAVKAGNTSLKGTELILTDPGARTFVETLPDTITALDLTEDKPLATGTLQGCDSPMSIDRLFPNLTDENAAELERFGDILKKVWPLKAKHRDHLKYDIRDMSRGLTSERSERKLDYMGDAKFLSPYLCYSCRGSLPHVPPVHRA